MGGMDWLDLAQERGRWRCCECRNEPLGSLKCRDFFSLAEDLLAFQGGLRFID